MARTCKVDEIRQLTTMLDLNNGFSGKKKGEVGYLDEQKKFNHIVDDMSHKGLQSLIYFT